jgi:hypothetical protein
MLMRIKMQNWYWLPSMGNNRLTIKRCWNKRVASGARIKLDPYFLPSLIKVFTIVEGRKHVFQTPGMEWKEMEEV